MGMCTKCCAVAELVFGALLLLNAYVWPRWLGLDGWVAWVAVLLVLGGFLGLVFGGKCPACRACAMPEGKAPAKKR